MMTIAKRLSEDRMRISAKSSRVKEETMRCNTTVPMRRAATGIIAVVFAALLAIGGIASAQNLVKGNKYAMVTVNPVTGQFYIDDAQGVKHLMYPDWTSHTNFLMVVSSTQQVYTNDNNNAHPVYIDAGHTQLATVKLPNRVIFRGDSIVAIWDTLYGFHIEQYTYPFLSYGGGFIGVEYRVTKVDSNTSNFFKGVLFEMDIYVDDPRGICPGTGNDKALVLDAHGYEAKPRSGVQGCWDGVNADYKASAVPEWFHAAGLFPNIGSTISLGRFFNPSVETPLKGGPVLTPPDEFAVGDWGNNSTKTGLKDVAWNIYPIDLPLPGTYVDAAAIMKWNASGDNWRCCMMYGPDDRSNDHYLCPDQGVFVDLRFPKRVDRDPVTKVFNPPIDTIRIWAANTQWDGTSARNMTATIDTVGTCVLLTPGQTLSKPMLMVGGPASNDVQTQRSGYAEFYLRVDSGRCCNTAGNFVEDTISVKVTTSNFPNFGYPCQPTATIQCQLTPPDTMKPRWSGGQTTFANYSWTVADSQQYDLGIDSIVVRSSTNYRVTVPGFTHCTKSPVTITANVIDTTKQGCVTIDIIDCAKNVAEIVQCFTPSPDKFPPAITVIDTLLPSVGPSLCSPSSLFKKVLMKVDELRPLDGGIQTITQLQSTNCTVSVPAFNVGAKTVTVTFQVIDSLENASASIQACDVNSNCATAGFTYCTVQDHTPPVVIGGKVGSTYAYRITETSPWDRGLLDVNVTQQTNVNVNGPTFLGDTAATISFTIADTSKDANFCFTARDSFFVNTSDQVHYVAGDSNHLAGPVCGGFTSGVDTMAPYVRIIPNAATNGYDATVITADRHYLSDGTLYLRDKKLNIVTFSNLENADTSDAHTPQACLQDSMTFGIRALDTLSLTDSVSTLCVQVSDCEGLKSNVACWSYNIIPDTVPPTVDYSLGATRADYVIHMHDSTAYDRGLGNVVVDELQNVAPASESGLNGVRQHDVTLHIVDTTQPAHARVCVTDRWSEVHPSRQSVQQTCFSFDTWVIPVSVDPLTVGYGGNDISMSVHLGWPAPPPGVQSVEFNFTYPDASSLHVIGAGSTVPGVTGSVISDGTWSTGLRRARVRFSAPSIPGGTDPIGFVTFHADRIDNLSGGSVIVLPDSIAFNNYITVSAPAPNVVRPIPAPFGTAGNAGNITLSGRCKQVLLRAGATPFALAQSVPNPTTGVVTIAYAIDRMGPMRLALYDRMGVLVRELVAGDGKPGNYQLTANLGDLRDGVYFYRLEVNGATAIRAISLMR